MHTHKPYFLFYPTFFIQLVTVRASICFPCPRLGLSRWNRRQGCRENRGLVGVLSLTGHIWTSSIYDFCLGFHISVFWLKMVV